MDVRTFEAFSMKDAIKAVKKNLGSDAVILSTREKKSHQGTNLIFEVTAAASASLDSGHLATNKLLTDNMLGEFSREAESLKAIFDSKISGLSESIATRHQMHLVESGISELKLLLMEFLRKKDGSSISGLPLYLVPLERQLRTMSVDDATIVDLLRFLQNESIFEAEQSKDSIENFYRDKAIRWLMKRIKIAPKWQINIGNTSVHAFVGPTGSGKTSIITKIAAQYHKKKLAKVKVVSLDRHRLAATEQMRIFCKILNIPFEPLTQIEDIDNLLQSSLEFDLILLDTPGLSPKDKESISSLSILKSKNATIDFHLTLSVTEKESQMHNSVRSFSHVGLNSLVFTKLDESWSFGEIYNVAKKWGLPLSFFGVGRDIPGDLERASRERVVEQIFGIK